MKYYELNQMWGLLNPSMLAELEEVGRPKTVRFKRLWALRLYKSLIGYFSSLRRWICGEVEVPATLDDCSIGTILTLSQSTDPNDAFSELLGLSEEQIALLDAEEAVGFLNFVKSELERINRLLASARVEPTAEERQAGVEEIGREVGSFATIDHLAKRCGITHDQAFELKWKRVLAMYMLDRDSELFRRRLTEVYRNKKN